MSDALWLSKSEQLKNKSNCVSSHFGAIIVCDGKIVGSGFNGTDGDSCVPECARCQDRLDGKINSGEEYERCICIHAEQRAILDMLKNNPNVKKENCTMYVQSTPCHFCANVIISAGIGRLVSYKLWKCEDNTLKLADGGVNVEIHSKKNTKLKKHKNLIS